MIVTNRVIAAILAIITVHMGFGAEVEKPEGVFTTQFVLSPALEKAPTKVKKKIRPGTVPVATPVASEESILTPYQAEVLTISRDGQLIITGGGADGDGIVQAWNFEGIKQWDFSEFGPKGSVSILETLPDGKGLLVGSGDGTIRVLDIETGKEISCLDGEGSQPNRGRPVPFAFAFQPKGYWGALITANAVLYELDLRDLPRKSKGFHTQALNSYDLMTHGFNSARAVVTPDGQHLLVLASQCSCLLQVRDLTEVSFIRHYKPFQAAAFRPQGEELQVLLGSTHGFLELWRMKTAGPDPYRLKSEKVVQFSEAPISPTELQRRLATGRHTRPDSGSFTERNRGEMIREFKAPGIDRAHESEGWIKQVVFSPDGQFAASAAIKFFRGADKLLQKDKPEGGSLRIWHVDSGQEVVCLKNDKGFWSCRFVTTSEGKNYIVSSCADNTVHIRPLSELATFAVAATQPPPPLAEVGPE